MEGSGGCGLGGRRLISVEMNVLCVFVFAHVDSVGVNHFFSLLLRYAHGRFDMPSFSFSLSLFFLSFTHTKWLKAKVRLVCHMTPFAVIYYVYPTSPFHSKTPVDVIVVFVSRNQLVVLRPKQPICKHPPPIL